MTNGLLSALVAVSVASCGAGGGAGTRSDLSSASRGLARAALGPMLAGDGIAGVKFGRSPAVVAARLGRRFGPPVGADQIAHGYIRAGCGFYWEVWDGLGASSYGRRFVAQLTAWFRHARFVGYSYGPNNFQTELSTWSQYASHPMMLATSTGLAVGDPLARGQRLYGRAFAVTTRPQGTPPDPRLIRLPVWEASTRADQLRAGLESPTWCTALTAHPSGRSAIKASSGSALAWHPTRPARGKPTGLKVWPTRLLGYRSAANAGTTPWLLLWA